jgi:hypothetical protein
MLAQNNNKSKKIFVKNKPIHLNNSINLVYLISFGIQAYTVRVQNNNTSSSLQAESIARNKISALLETNAN